MTLETESLVTVGIIIVVLCLAVAFLVAAGLAP